MLSIKRFCDDRDGAVTIWLLMWSIIFLGFAGLAVDVSNAYRTRAMLQATADAAAHAGAIRLVNGNGTKAEVEAEAISYAQENLPTASNGTVVLASDVTLITYVPDPNNPGKGTPYTGMADPNGVHVIAQRATVAGETSKLPLPTSLLRIVDFNSWNITVEAIAAAGGGFCTGKANWMLAQNDVQFTSGNGFGGDLCVYGKNGIEGNMNNASADGVVFGWGDASKDSAVYGWDVQECDGCEQRAAMEIPETEKSALEAIAVTAVGIVRERLYPPSGGGPSVFPLHKIKNGGNPSAETLMGQAYASGSRNFHITCNTSNVSVDLGQMVAEANNHSLATGGTGITSLSGVTIYTGPSGSGAPGVEGDPCELVGSNINFGPTIIASANTKGGSIVDPGNSASASTDNVSVKLNGQPVAGGNCVSEVTTWDDGLNIFSLGGVNFTAQGDFNTLRIYAQKNVNFTAGPSTTGGLDIRTAEAISFTAGATFDPDCAPADGTIDFPWDIKRVRLVW
ncbi:hypothetical protein H0I76_16465 [Limibaculum sp. M0105]|uniref:Putative Flp pilus-assembly TadG-like N-terminal domain-containing protein n=1 Tax=Thermohalobaculum xanthum TaxID=2753746 RepID=A0A8J7M9M6_9RHOB|nr:pilus assembly protein TadG-related protein [Thermohalobaculum xanthum]MBK0400795.1 hypothetical protein [Thermohalobaculum xanthum]